MNRRWRFQNRSRTSSLVFVVLPPSSTWSEEEQKVGCALRSVRFLTSKQTCFINPMFYYLQANHAVGPFGKFSVAQRMRRDYDEKFLRRGAWTLLMRWCKFSSVCYSSQQERRWFRAILHRSTPHVVHFTDVLMFPRLCELFTLHNPHRVRFFQ